MNEAIILAERERGSDRDRERESHISGDCIHTKKTKKGNFNFFSLASLKIYIINRKQAIRCWK